MLCQNSGAYTYVYLLISIQRLTTGLNLVGVVQAADHMLDWMKMVLAGHYDLDKSDLLRMQGRNIRSVDSQLNDTIGLYLNQTLDKIESRAVNYFSLANGLYLVSAAMGSLFAGHFVPIYGRKSVLFYNALWSLMTMLVFSTCVY